MDGFFTAQPIVLVLLMVIVLLQIVLLARQSRIERRLDRFGPGTPIPPVQHPGLEQAAPQQPMRPPVWDGQPQSVDPRWAEVTLLVRQGKKIEAIKRYREVTGAGLRDAKEAVERME